ncbi:hypothetical protein QN277_003932 [Acacia crassicarpa]|uniref:Uncharacterized protein n=1 Tax=Acacia crassicarpa TaxID=499986 RepID=A0AAE1JWY4_9FABA|nr:hypothetical protein QN277_003932 [Acacia crassicarpa]
MQSFKTSQSTPQQLYCHPSFFLRGDDAGRNPTRFSDLGELQHSVSPFQHDDAVDLSSSSMFTVKSSNVAVATINLQYGTLSSHIGSSEMATTGAGCLNTGQHLMYQKGFTAAGAAMPTENGHMDNWGDSGMVDNSQHTDTSTDIDPDDKNQCNHRVRPGRALVADSMEQPKANPEDLKTLRRLAQNREAAKKSRLRKKAYVQQLENSRVRLAQLEQELQRARQQGMVVASGHPGDHSHSMVGNGALAFDMDYARWLDEHQQLINELRTAVNSHMGDNELHIIVEGVTAHYDELFRLKCIGAKADVFHILYGPWKTPAERCFSWLGGFRSSELLQLLRNQLEPLAEQQTVGLSNLQRSSSQAEDALSQGMDALHQSLSEILSSASSGSGDVAEYMAQMALAMSKLATLESFVYQAELLRQQTLQQLQKILTTRQIARAYLVINDYISRLRALSSLWLARPRE